MLSFLTRGADVALLGAGAGIGPAGSTRPSFSQSGEPAAVIASFKAGLGLRDTTATVRTGPCESRRAGEAADIGACAGRGRLAGRFAAGTESLDIDRGDPLPASTRGASLSGCGAAISCSAWLSDACHDTSSSGLPDSWARTWPSPVWSGFRGSGSSGRGNVGAYFSMAARTLPVHFHPVDSRSSERAAAAPLPLFSLSSGRGWPATDCSGAVARASRASACPGALSASSPNTGQRAMASSALAACSTVPSAR